jgi:predicted regulator of Ras-like GTPase activity (Roadblock/LC7/MglB family)
MIQNTDGAFMEKILRASMYKIAGINQMILTSKKSGDVIAASSKFVRKENIENIAALSNTLYQLSRVTDKGLDSSIFEFATGEKLFTVLAGDVILSTVCDPSVQLGISRMYLKKFTESIDKVYKKVQDTVKVDDGKANELADIFKGISQS